MSKINQEEYEVLKGLDDKWKWIARNDMYGAKLEAHTSRPDKMIDSHWSNGDMALQLLGGEHLFQFVQWSDEEPYSIQELIKEYEFGKILLAMAEEEVVLEIVPESEETEVKDKKWLQDSITRVMQDLFSTPKPNYFDFEKANKRMRELVDQLDEPETPSPEKIRELESLNDELIRDNNQLRNELDNQEILSKEWIDENITESDIKGNGYVAADALYDKLVPKQEITEEQAYNKIAESLPVTAKEIETVLEKYYSNMLIEISEEMNESIMRAFEVEVTSKTIEALTGMTLEQIAEEARNGGIVPKQEEREQLEIAYKDILSRGEFWLDDKKYVVVEKEEPLSDGEVKLIVGFDGGTESYSLNSVDEAFETLADYGTKYKVIEKPTIPQFVAEWYEEKDNIERAIYWECIAHQERVSSYKPSETDEFGEWFTDTDNKPIETLINMKYGYKVEEREKYVIDTDDAEISDSNHYLTYLSLSKDFMELPVVGCKDDAIRFEDKEQAQAVADYVGGRVEELEE